MDRWLSAIDRDDRHLPLSRKVVEDKPAYIVDTCWIEDHAVTDPTTCRNAFGYYGDPRIAAGGPLTDDIRKCALKPLDRSDYRVTFTDAQWAELERAFPSGVCDWRRPGVDQGPSTPWMSYAGGPGGAPLGPPPRPR